MVEHIDLQQEATQIITPNLQSKYKLLNHLDKVLEWEKKGTTYPILVNMTLTNSCSHRCPLCTSRDFLDARTMSYEQAKEIIVQLKEVDVKAMGLGGGGDPTCHPHLKEIIEFISQQGIEVSLTTNGQLLNDEIIDAAIQNCTWIRVSLDADGPQLFKRMHGMDEAAFYKVTENISKLVETRKRLKSDVVIGVTYLIGPHTVEGVYNACALAKKLGVDYIRIRPFFTWDDAKKSESENKGIASSTEQTSIEQTAFSVKTSSIKINTNINKRDGSQRVFPPKQIREAKAEEIFKELERCTTLQDEHFSVSYPKDRFQTIGANQNEGETKRTHKLCYVHHFTTVIAADAKVYPCCMLENNEKYCLGSLKEKKFKELWHSDERKKAYAKIDFKDCPNPCMLEKHNELLWTIKQGGEINGINLKETLYATKEMQQHANFL